MGDERNPFVVVRILLESRSMESERLVMTTSHDGNISSCFLRVAHLGTGV
jgi:hypothetical protein